MQATFISYLKAINFQSFPHFQKKKTQISMKLIITWYPFGIWFANAKPKIPGFRYLGASSKGDFIFNEHPKYWSLLHIVSNFMFSLTLWDED